MCLTHFSTARASLALGYWIAVAEERGAQPQTPLLLAGATVPQGFGVALLLNPVFSRQVGKRGKASPDAVGA